MQVARHWRTRSQRYSLTGEICDQCKTYIFPPRDVCPECEAPAKTPYAFSGNGQVYSYSTVYQAPEGYEQFAPYTVGLVQLEEGPMVTAQITDIEPDKIEVGMPVEMVTRKLREEGEEGLIVYGYKFRPRLSSSPV